MAVQLAGIALFCSIGRSNVEVAERLEFLRRQRLEAEVTREKVLRVMAEHAVERGPFRSNRPGSEHEVERSPGRSNRPGTSEASPSMHSHTMSSIIFSVPVPNNMPDASGIPQMQFDAMRSVAQKDHWYIEPEELVCSSENQLGQGGMGVVFRGEYLGTEVAVKVPTGGPSAGLAGLSNRLRALGDELRTLRRIRHPNIVSFFGACFIIGQGEVLLVEEFVDGLSLSRVLKSPDVSLDSHKRLHVLKGICSALAYLHGQSPAIVHGDLKPDNIILETGSMKPKLIDFGLAGLAKAGSHVKGGTIQWQAPEVLVAGLMASVVCSTDIFAFGRLVFFVMTGKRPLQAVLQADIMDLAKQGRAPDLCWPAEVAVHPRVPLLCQKCVSLAPSERPEAEVVLEELIAVATSQPFPDQANFLGADSPSSDTRASRLQMLLKALVDIRTKQQSLHKIRGASPATTGAQSGVVLEL
ncbi:unnamed protein product [Polarella glacialis]|uniref:Protein kinase domain-containing protein n=1 Tax=Polarella glacialis TaxID=89957 RepID=A0A813IZP3_POLGL|nr:unnamed protein product [Polarella glacialis]